MLSKWSRLCFKMAQHIAIEMNMEESQKHNVELELSTGSVYSTQIHSCKFQTSHSLWSVTRVKENDISSDIASGMVSQLLLHVPMLNVLVCSLCTRLVLNRLVCSFCIHLMLSMLVCSFCTLLALNMLACSLCTWDCTTLFLYAILRHRFALEDYKEELGQYLHPLVKSLWNKLKT